MDINPEDIENLTVLKGPGSNCTCMVLMELMELSSLLQEKVKKESLQ
jgi:hypothetical protein